MIDSVKLVPPSCFFTLRLADCHTSCGDTRVPRDKLTLQQLFSFICTLKGLGFGSLFFRKNLQNSFHFFFHKLNYFGVTRKE